MKKLLSFYRRSSWHPVYNFMTTGGKARSNLLFAMIAQSIVNGFSGGIFYTGLLVGYGINIVNISILAVIPSICSIFSILSPLVLSRFKQRRTVLSVARVLYYVINILGITLIPQVIHSDGGRVAGLIAVVFLSNTINFIFNSGYSAWHMSHITEDVRMDYFSSSQLVSNLTGNLVMIVASLFTDNLTGDAQLTVILILRYAAFAIAFLDVYFMQKPREPEYKLSTQRLSLVKVFTIPLGNKKFMLTLLVHVVYLLTLNLSASVMNAWLLEEVHVSYLYINVINALYCLYIPATTPIWRRIARKSGTFGTMGINMLLQIPPLVAYAWVTPSNYLWLMTIVRLFQHCLGVGVLYSVSNLIYVNLPETDQDSYITLFNLAANITNFVTMSIGTAIVAAMGSNTLHLFGHDFTSVPVIMLIQSVMYLLVALFAFCVRPKVDPYAPPGRKRLSNKK